MKLFLKSFFIILFAFFAFLPTFVQAQDSADLTGYLFYGDGCPHCAKERVFLDELEKTYSNVSFKEFEIYHNFANIDLLKEVAETLQVRVEGVPFLVVGDEVFSGYSETASPKEIQRRVEYCLENTCPDTIATILSNGHDDVIVSTTPETEVAEETSDSAVTETTEAETKTFHVPIVGEIDARTFSLPVLAVVMGVLDGFNPCAMWTLIFLISLLLGMKDRKRMWILGTAFIVASASVYFVFMAAWLNLILLLGFIIWIRLLIGLLALFGGGYNLKEYFFNKDNTCKVTRPKSRQRIFEKLKTLVQEQHFALALAGIILLAIAVNLVELICSAGLPAVYTQILAINELATWKYYFYIFLYILFFMIDDLFVFFAAMITLHMTGITTKYTRLSHLIGGILMLLIGVLLIFKPEWLMFG